MECLYESQSLTFAEWQDWEPTPGFYVSFGPEGSGHLSYLEYLQIRAHVALIDVARAFDVPVREMLVQLGWSDPFFADAIPAENVLLTRERDPARGVAPNAEQG